MVFMAITPFFYSSLPSARARRAQQSSMPQDPTNPSDHKSLSRSLGEFFGHIWKGVQTPVDPPPPQKQILKHETTEQARETEQGKVIVRRTVVEELEIPTPPPKK